MGKFSVLSKQGREEISCTLSVFPLDRVNSFQGEELRVICGTRGDPGTVAPFRAWRGSRDLVAQNPKFHAPAPASISANAVKSLAQRLRPSQNARRPRLFPFRLC